MVATEYHVIGEHHASGIRPVDRPLISRQGPVVAHVKARAMDLLQVPVTLIPWAAARYSLLGAVEYASVTTIHGRSTSPTYQHITRYQQKRKSSKKRKSPSTITSSLVKARKHPGGTDSPQTPLPGIYIPICSDTSNCIVSTTLSSLDFCPTNGVHFSTGGSTVDC
jgi:hypothetical protein